MLSYSATVAATPPTGQSGYLAPYYDLYFTLDGATIFTVSHGLTNLSDSTHGTLSGSAVIAVPAEFQARVSALQSGSSGGSVSLELSLNQGYSNFGPGSGLVQFSQVSAKFGEATPTPEPAGWRARYTRSVVGHGMRS